MLTRKDEKWRWEEAQQKAFDELKQVFTTKPVLAAPDLDKEFRVEADASNYATGGVLSMKCSDEKWRPVAFISKSLSDTERNYEIHNKEMLAVVRCLEAWCQVQSGTGWSGPELSGVTPEWKGFDNKMEQPWPQLVCCASIYCRVCGCVFQEDGIVVRSFGEEWYRLIGVRIGQG